MMDFYKKYYEGIFWIPTNEENKIIGTLFIDDNGVATISLLQPINGELDFEKLSQFEVVYGLINSNDSSKTYTIKLYDTKQNLNSIGGLNKFKYVSCNSFITSGVDDNIIEENYKSLMLNSKQIYSWIDITGFQPDTNVSENFLTNQLYIQPKPIRLFKNDDFEIYIFFRASSTSTSLLNRKSIVNEEVFINIETTENYSINEIVKYKNEIEWLFNLFLYRPFNFEIFECSNMSKKNYRSISKPKELMYQLKKAVDFNLVKKNSQKIFKMWFLKKPSLELSLKNFFSVYGQKGVLIENRFVTYVSVIENYHRKNIDIEETRLVIEKYFEKVKFKKHRKVEYPNFQQRLIYVLYNSTLISKINNLVLFTQIITDTRDFHVHLLESKKEKSMTWKEITKLNNLLEIVIRELFLKEIGISELKEHLFISEIKAEEIELNCNNK